jgi:RNA polymerase sigma-70 factor (ECF subfamily)
MKTSEMSIRSMLVLATRFEPELVRRARQLTGNDSEARDLVQDTFERVLRAARAPTALHEFRPWMIRMLTNLWIDRVRTLKRRRNVPLTDSLGLEPEALRDRDSRVWLSMTIEDVQNALAEVPEPHRSAYRKHAMEGRSYHELARELGVPTSTVGTRILRARRCLRRILEHKRARTSEVRRADVHTSRIRMTDGL